MSEDALRNELIGGTVSSASANSHFYKRRFSDVDLSDIRTVSDLQILPVLTKQEVRDAGPEILCKGLRASHVQNTSGSTGTPLIITRSIEEKEFIWEFFYEAHKHDAPDLNPLILFLVIPHHGTATPVPGHAFVLNSAVTDDELIEQTLILLSSDFEFPNTEQRISAIGGSYSQVLTFTNYVLEHNIDAPAFRIQLIEVTGNYLTPRWRNVLSETWGCRVSDRYSMAEIFGGAIHCADCGCYHFDPHVVPEVVTLSDREPRASGPGELLLTSLYPFVQMQPFIRYATGDVFEIKPSSCSMTSWAFSGRVAHSLFDPREPDKLLIAGRTLLDAVDLYPQVARNSMYNDITGMNYHNAPGRPAFHGHVRPNGKKLEIHLVIELTYTPDLFKQATNDLFDNVRYYILQNSEGLSSDVEEGSIKLSVAAIHPGGLSPVIKATNVWEYL